MDESTAGGSGPAISSSASMMAARVGASDKGDCNEHSGVDNTGEDSVRPAAAVTPR